MAVLPYYCNPEAARIGDTVVFGTLLAMVFAIVVAFIFALKRNGIKKTTHIVTKTLSDVMWGAVVGITAVATATIVFFLTARIHIAIGAVAFLATAAYIIFRGTRSTREGVETREAVSILTIIVTLLSAAGSIMGGTTTIVIAIITGGIGLIVGIVSRLMHEEKNRISVLAMATIAAALGYVLAYAIFTSMSDSAVAGTEARHFAENKIRAALEEIQTYGGYKPLGTFKLCGPDEINVEKLAITAGLSPKCITTISKVPEVKVRSSILEIEKTTMMYLGVGCGGSSGIMYEKTGKVEKPAACEDNIWCVITVLPPGG